MLKVSLIDRTAWFTRLRLLQRELMKQDTNMREAFPVETRVDTDYGGIQLAIVFSLE